MTTEQLLKKFKRQSTKVLLSKYTRLSDQEKQVCLQVLESRDIDTSDLRGSTETQFREIDDRSIVEVAPEVPLTEEESIRILQSELPEAPTPIKKESIQLTKKVTKSRQIRDLFDQGKNCREIVEETGFDYTLCYDVIKAYEKKKNLA